MTDTKKITFQLTARDDRRLEVRVDAPGGQARGEAAMPDLRLLDEIGAQDPSRIPGELVERTGRALYNALVSEDVDEVVVDTLNDVMRAGETAQMELRFDPDQVALTRWPWEMIQNTHGQFLVRDGVVDLTRYITYPQPPPTFDQSIRGLPLFRVIAMPTDLPQLTADPLGIQPIETLEHATFDAFIRKLLIERLSLWGLQFDGHGALVLQCPYCETLNDPNGSTCWKCSRSLDEARHIGALAFEKDGLVNWVATAEFGSVLYNARIRLAMLLACESAAVGGKMVFNGLAPGLLLAGVPAVIGMQYPVLDSFANSFANEFYNELARSGDLLSAMRIARRVNMQGAWYSPALYLRRQPAPADQANHSVYLTRNIDTAAPSRVKAGVTFLVRLWIRRPETKPLTAARLRAELDIPSDVQVRQGHGEAEIMFEPAIGRRLRRGEVEVTLTSTGADVTPSRMKLFIDETLDAPPAIFTVRAVVGGAIPLVFNVLQDGGVIHTVTHRLEAVLTEDPAEIAEHSAEVRLESPKTPPFGTKLPLPGDSGGSALGTRRVEILSEESRVPAPPRPATPAPAPAPEQPEEPRIIDGRVSQPPPEPQPSDTATRVGAAHPMAQTFIQAMTAYSSGDLETAYTLLRKCLDGGLSSPEVVELMRRVEHRLGEVPRPEPSFEPPPPPHRQQWEQKQEKEERQDRDNKKQERGGYADDDMLGFGVETPAFDMDQTQVGGKPYGRANRYDSQQTQQSVPPPRLDQPSDSPYQPGQIARPVPAPPASGMPLPMPAQGARKSGGFPIWIVIGGLLMLLCLAAVAMVVLTGLFGQ